MKVISRSQALTLTSNVYTTKCSINGTGPIKNTLNLDYKWTISKGDDDVSSSITSIAKVPNLYKLPSYTLQSGYVIMLLLLLILLIILTTIYRIFYSIRLSVYYNVDLTSADTLIQVFVEPSAIVAVISGGAQRNLLPGRSIDLDASGSYDLDLSSDEVPNFSYRY